MKAVTLQVDDEVAALGDLVAKEVADIKAKAGIVVELTDAIPALISLAGAYKNLSADVKKSDDIAYLVKCVADAFIPAPVATA